MRTSPFESTAVKNFTLAVQDWRYAMVVVPCDSRLIKMSDRNNWLVSESALAAADGQLDDIAHLGKRGAGEAWTGPSLRLVATSSLTADAGSVAVQAPGRGSHLARLINAVQRSRRLQAAKVRRRHLHLVQGEHP
jgi:hypothetical protein